MADPLSMRQKARRPAKAPAGQPEELDLGDEVVIAENMAAPQPARGGYQNPGAMVLEGSGMLPKSAPPKLNSAPALPVGTSPGLPGTDALVKAAWEDFRRQNIGRLQQNLSGPQGAGSMAQAETMAMEQFKELSGQARKLEQMGLERTTGLGELGVKGGQLGVNQQQANTQRELGLGGLNIQQQQADTTRELGQGGLKLQDRKQQTDEYKLAHDMDQDRRGTRAIDAMLVSPGMTPDVARQLARLRNQLLPQTPPPPGFTPGQSGLGQQGAPNPAAPQGQPGAAGGPGGTGKTEIPVDRWTDAFGDEVSTELRTIKEGKVPGVELKNDQAKLSAAAKLLARKMDHKGAKAGTGDAMMEYLKDAYGEEAFRAYAQPTPIENLREFVSTGLGSMVGNGRPSEEMDLRSKYRNLAGLERKHTPGYMPALGTGLPGYVGGAGGYLMRSLLGSDKWGK